MNYIELLTQEETAILSGIMGGRGFKDLFKSNENEFQKIRKGFRVKGLTDDLALSIAISNINKPFVAGWINFSVKMWLDEMQKNREALEKQGKTPEIALATTILDSVFSNSVELYIKLSENSLDQYDIARLIATMSSVEFERTKEKENDESVKIEYEQRIQAIEQEKKALNASLTEAQSKLAELQSAATETKSDEAEYFSQFDDTNQFVLPTAGSEETVSLCGVITDYNGQKWLIRYADLSYHGHYHVFRKNEALPPYFANRDKLFYRDGPDEDGFYGLWSWSAVPNGKDPSKDYVVSQYKEDLDAIEVVIIPGAATTEDLINLLKEGYEYEPHSRRILFAIYESKGQYRGILCSIKDLTSADGYVSFAENCTEVPEYEFTNDDILRLDNGLSFYKNAFAGHTSKLHQLKNPLDIVKNIVFSCISWTTYKTRGFSRAEYKNFKDFLSAIPVEDIVQRIETECHCSNSAAIKLLDEFKDIAWKYVDGNSIEDEVIVSAVSANKDLQERTKALIRADWEAENESLLADAQKKLESAGEQLERANKKLNEIQETYKATKQEEENLSAIIAEKEKLAENVEKAVDERIQRARDKAADFIANMAFVNAQPSQSIAVVATAAHEGLQETVASPYRTHAFLSKLDELEAHLSWEDVIYTTAFELEAAGVAEKYRDGLAAFLCAAYIEKQPILLVGPNAIEIAEAFSAAAAGHKHGVLYCEGNYNHQVLDEIGNDGEDIVIINNLIASGWMNRLPEMLSKRDIFYMATHPYAEDVQVEPKSLYGYMLPLFTEFFVDGKATGKYVGGYFAENFKPYSASQGKQKELKVLSRFALNSLMKNRINTVVTTMHSIRTGTTSDDDFLFAVLPIAYALQEMNELKQVASDSQDEGRISANLKRDLRYVLGDI